LAKFTGPCDDSCDEPAGARDSKHFTKKPTLNSLPVGSLSTNNIAIGIPSCKCQLFLFIKRTTTFGIAAALRGESAEEQIQLDLRGGQSLLDSRFVLTVFVSCLLPALSCSQRINAKVTLFPAFGLMYFTKIQHELVVWILGSNFSPTGFFCFLEK
jgi:hypothetical protein